MRLPLGLAYDDRDEVVLDPDRTIVEAISLVFAMFRRTGSAMQTLKWFRNNAVTLPSRPYRMHGEVIWSVPNHSQILFILHNPRYAGCFVYGRSRTRKLPDGKAQYSKLAMEDWQVCIPQAHAGYIDWDEYCRNQETLENNRTGFMPGAGRQPPPRDGLALLQSRVICGHCGHRMTSHYNPARPDRNQAARWYYYCRHNIVRHGARTCQSLRGPEVDAASGNRPNAQTRGVVQPQNLSNLTLGQPPVRHRAPSLKPGRVPRLTGCPASLSSRAPSDPRHRSGALQKSDRVPTGITVQFHRNR